MTRAEREQLGIFQHMSPAELLAGHLNVAGQAVADRQVLPRKSISIRCPIDVYAQLVAIAEVSGSSVNSVIVELLRVGYQAIDEHLAHDVGDKIDALVLQWMASYHEDQEAAE